MVESQVTQSRKWKSPIGVGVAEIYSSSILQIPGHQIGTTVSNLLSEPLQIKITLN